MPVALPINTFFYQIIVMDLNTVNNHNVLAERLGITTWIAQQDSFERKCSKQRVTLYNLKVFESVRSARSKE